MRIKSRAKRLAREGQGPERGHTRSRRRQGGFSRTEQFFLLGLVAVVAIALGLMAESALQAVTWSPPPLTQYRHPAP